VCVTSPRGKIVNEMPSIKKLPCFISMARRASILRPALRDYGGQVVPAYAKASAGRHGAKRRAIPQAQYKEVGSGETLSNQV
jgi:hypothetical protein